MHEPSLAGRFSTEYEGRWFATRTAEIAVTLGATKRWGHELGIVVAELVSNAVKFGGSGEIRLYQLEIPAPGIAICVRDFGPGIRCVSEVRKSRRKEVDKAPATAGSLGIGLGSLQDYMNCIETHRLPGKCSCVVAARWDKGCAPPGQPVRPKRSEGASTVFADCSVFSSFEQCCSEVPVWCRGSGQA